MRTPIRLRRRTLLCLLLASFVLWPAAALARHPVLLGLYPGGHLDQTSTITDMQEVDTWIAPTGHRIAIAGDFIDIEYAPGLSVPLNLSGAWDNGWVPFVKLLAVRSAAEIVNGAIDPAISAWGQHLALWSEGGTKRAFIAPLPEMNGEWTPYYGTPAVLVQAYLRIRDLIRAELRAANVPQNAISWVFAPNGWSLPGDEFEHFYPGHDEVDVVSFSAYNWGACPPWHRWETFEDAFEPYLLRMRAMAPGKPIFIAETAVIDRPSQPIGDRNEWLRDTYTRLAAFPRLRGIMYFNRTLPTVPNLPNCPNPDFRLHIPGTDEWRGFKDALADPTSRFGYWAPTSPEMADIVFAPTVPRVFHDIHPIHPFAAEPGDIDYSPWIHALAASGVTSGCSASPPRFCPTDSVTRAQMAVFLLRGIHGAGYTTPQPTGSVFVDVAAGNIYARWIERLSAEGITAGCGGGRYCPDNPVTRGQMAVFLLRGKYGAGFVPPPATGTVFGDVPASYLFAPWIERLAADNITAGCGGGNYCPEASITRQQMAVFLVRAFALTMATTRTTTLSGHAIEQGQSEALQLAAHEPSFAEVPVGSRPTATRGRLASSSPSPRRRPPHRPLGRT